MNIKYWLEEEKRIFEGWDFSSIHCYVDEEPLPWDYKKLVNDYLEDKKNLLDMGTGGGEVLLTLNYPRKTYATEAYRPNYEFARESLKSKGIELCFIENDKLPYENHLFDVVTNRHESYDINEVYRVLKPGGIFITQQVGGQNNLQFAIEMMHINPTVVGMDFSLETERKLFKEHDFSILYGDEYFPKLKFTDVGAFVYFAKIIEWEFPGFSVETHLDNLKNLQALIDWNGYFETIEHRFILIAQKTG